MQHLRITLSQPRSHQPVFRAGSALPDVAAPQGCQCEAHDNSDRQFVAMLDAYRDSGGLCRARELQEVIARSTDVGGSDVAALNGWIMQREVICFNWQGKPGCPGSSSTGWA